MLANQTTQIPQAICTQRELTLHQFLESGHFSIALGESKDVFGGITWFKGDRRGGGDQSSLTECLKGYYRELTDGRGSGKFYCDHILPNPSPFGPPPPLRTVSPIEISRVPSEIAVANFLFYLYTSSTGPDVNDAENQIVVDNDARNVEIPCVINTDGLSWSDLGLYMCPTMVQCRSDRDRFKLARIEKNTIFNYYPEDFKVSLNGSLIVRKMSSKYDGMVVWCIGQVQYHGARENTTLIKIAKGTTLPVLL